MTVKENDKGFRVIKMSLVEVNEILGGYGICDFCNKERKETQRLCVLCVRILCDLCVEEEEVGGCLNESRSTDGIPRMIDSGEK